MGDRMWAYNYIYPSELYHYWDRNLEFNWDAYYEPGLENERFK